MKKRTNEEFLKELTNLNNGITALDKYIDNKTKIRFRCRYGHIWLASPQDILYGKSGCPFCSGRYPILGETDLWTTRPDIARMMKNKDDGYKYSQGSHKQVDFICPNCGAVLHKEIKTVCQQGIGCKYCSDHISYPNKFIREVLKYTDVINIEPEWSPEWIGQYRYDIYFEKDNKPYIVEMDGGLGHGCREIRSKDRLTSKEVDVIKDTEAMNHNITLIRIDCNYGKIYNRFEYIRDNIINSQLSKIIDLSYVDWDSCNINATSSYVILASKLFNDGSSVQDISDFCGYSTHTIRQWLYQAEKIGLCDCAVIHGTKRGTKPYKVKVNQYSMNGDYIKTFESVTAAHNETGIPSENICSCYKHKYKHAGNYRWFEVSDPTQPDPTKIIPNKMIKEEQLQ